MSVYILRMRTILLAATILIAGGCSLQAPLAETPPLEVVVCKPVMEKIEDLDIFTGTVSAKEIVEVRSRVRGHIEEIPFKEGDEIDAGADLFLLDSQPFKADLKQAKGQLATWQAKLTLADERIAIYKPLADKGTVSREELLSAMAAKGEALGGIETAKGKIMEAEQNIEFCRIRSKIAGRVGEALLTKGNLVNVGGGETLLTTVVSVDPMYVKFNVTEQVLSNYRRVLRERAAKNGAAEDPDKISFPLELALVGETAFSYKGVVDFVDNRIDPATSSQKVRGRFTNPKGPDGRRMMTSGAFARVRFSIVEAYPATLVAERAILTDQSQKYVLVVNKAKGNTVERVDVVVSKRAQDSGLRAVEAGLKGDEWIIVEGVNRVRPGVTVNPRDDKMPRRPIPAKTGN